MSNRWIITKRRFHRHKSYEAAATEMARLQALLPDAKFEIIRIKDAAETPTDVASDLLAALEACPLPSTMGTAEAHYRLFYAWYNEHALPAIAKATQTDGGEHV